MKKKFVLTSSIIMLALFVGGLAMVFGSTAMGRSEGHRVLQSNGGSMDTQEYYNIINSATENYRTAGMIVSLIGGLGIITSGYGVYREI